MQKMYFCSLLLPALFLVSINIAFAQFQLISDWTVNVHGDSYGVLNKHMAVVPGTGTRYYITQEFDDGYNFGRLDQDGNEGWRMSDRGGFRPHSIVYKNGGIFLLGTTSRIGDLNVRASLKMYQDIGTGPRLIWEHDVSEKGYFTHGDLLMVDPNADGVIFSAISKSHDLLVTVVKTQRISAAHDIVTFDDIDLGQAAYGATPDAYAMCVDPAGNVYITGLSDAVNGVESDGYVNASSQFIAKFNSAGRLQWMRKITEPGNNLYGFDIGVDATNIYVLGQRVREHSNTPVPVTEGTTTLKKLDPIDGRTINAVNLPSRIREYPTYRNLGRKSLLIDPTSDAIFVSYDAPEVSDVTLSAFNTSLDLQWSDNISLSGGAHFASLISTNAGVLVVGVNDRITGSTSWAIASFSRGGERFDTYVSPDGSDIVDMQADASGRIHVGGRLAEPISSPDGIGVLSYFEQGLHYFNPMLNYFTSPFLLELISEGRHLHWGSSGLTWNCAGIPCNATFIVSTSGASSSWKKVITKPTVVSLPQDDTFTTFRLFGKEQSGDRLLFEVDRTLIDNGVKSLGLEVDPEKRTLTISSTTEGPETTLTLSLIGKDGKVIRDLKAIAPGKSVISDLEAVPVSYISITAPEVSPSVTIYPNPSYGKMNVSLGPSVAFPVRLTMHDWKGTKVHQQLLYSSDTEVLINKLSPGLYFVRITANKLDVTKTMQLK